MPVNLLIGTYDEALNGTFGEADPALKAHVAALLASADALGVDQFFILDEAAKAVSYGNDTDQEYFERQRDLAINAIADAIRRSIAEGVSQGSESAAARGGDQDGGAGNGGAGFGLTSPTVGGLLSAQQETDNSAAQEAAVQA